MLWNKFKKYICSYNDGFENILWVCKGYLINCLFEIWILVYKVKNLLLKCKLVWKIFKCNMVKWSYCF